MTIDLHTHTTASDGALSPIELLERAEQNGVKMLAITDHDTLDGFLQADRMNNSAALELVPGVEFTTTIAQMVVHVVALWVDPNNDKLLNLIEFQKKVRQLRAQRIADKLAEKAGIDGVLEGAQQIAGGVAITRPHIARFLVANGHVKKEQRAYDKWLGKGKVADVPCEWPDIETVTDVVHQAGGIAVLAHPSKYGLTFTKLAALVQRFKEAGGDAIELVCGTQQDNKTKDLARLARKFELDCSSGSDYHSDAYLWCDVGRQKCIKAFTDATLKTVWQRRRCP